MTLPICTIVMILAEGEGRRGEARGEGTLAFQEMQIQLLLLEGKFTLFNCIGIQSVSEMANEQGPNLYNYRPRNNSRAHFLYNCPTKYMDT